ncbi:MAG: twin-arginine translocation signal domain-containing protein [Acidobacteria bacterium]|nr:twin-arginine translocation signal domain-containing protein [Acidobacteriota bacterium]
MHNRRDFLRASASTAAAASLSAAPAPVPAKTMVGIQVGAVSFVDEGTPKALDILQQRGAVNTLFLATFTYGRGIAGRQVPGQPLPDHGRQEYDLDFHGGNYGTVHPQYYHDTAIKPEDTRAPDHGNLDIIAEVLPQAKQRGMKTILWTEDVWRYDIPNIVKLQEVDLHGRPARRLCVNNPYHRNFLLGLVEDYARSYDIDGIMWGSERHGALGIALGSNHGGRGSDPASASCFCEHCEKKARALGQFQFERVRQGYLELEKFVRAGRAGQRPVDGYYVSFWRLLMRYPEILAWEQFWHDGLREIYSAMHARAHQIKPGLQVGWHIWHNNSFSPFYRAQQDLKTIAPSSDFLKMVIYHNCGGERMASYIDSVTANLYGDLPKQDALEFHYHVLNARERSYEQIPFTGLSADYVLRETQRAVLGAAGTSTLIWPGIDIDIPTGDSHSKSTPKGTKDAVLAAFKGGAHGVILSRKYSEMKLANLSGAGDAIRELKLA